MSVLIPNLAVAGEIINVPTNALSINVTLPNPVSEYIVSGQISTPTTCWLSGTDNTVATFSFGAPADAGSQLTIIALPGGTAGLTTVVLPAGTATYSVTTTTGQSVLPICQWNTQVWYQIFGNTWTFYFSAPSGVPSVFSYLVVGPGQNTEISLQPVDPADYIATISTTISDSALPIAVTSWNTAIGLTPEDNQVELQFTNGAPSFASTSVLVVSLPINISIFPLPVPAVVQQQMPWIVSVITPEVFASRITTLFPYPWLSDEARSTAGIAYAIFLAMGTELNYISQQLYYAWQACRLQTAVNGALDLFSMDYFGNNLPRRDGETDDAFRARIKALLFQPQVTREAIVNALELAYPGIVVRPLEGWNPSDTGYYADGMMGYAGSYYDYDSPTIPSLWGDWTTRYTGYFEIQLPQQAALSYNLWGYDFGAAYNSETGYFFPVIQEALTLIGEINQLLTQITALGTDIWVKYVVGIVTPFNTGGSYPIASGLINYTLNLPASSGFYLLFCQLSQPINVWQSATTPLSFTLTTAAPTPSATILNFLAIQNSEPGVGIASINRGDISYQVHADAVNNVVLFQGLWNNAAYYTNRSVNAITYNFPTPAPSGTQANYFAVPVSGQAFYQSVSANAITATADVTVNAQNIPYVMANWGTTIGCLPDPINSQVHLTFSVPAPADGTGEIAVVSYNINQIA